MKSSRTTTLLLAIGIAVAVGFGGAASAAGQSSPLPRSKQAPKTGDTTVRISSVPPGAMVMICPGNDFQERAAVPLGKTPLLRLLSLSERSMAVRITKTGYEAWNGQLSLVAPEIKADLSPLTDAQKQELGWFVSPPCQRLTLVPVRLGIRKIGSKSETFETSREAVNFTNRFLTSLEAKIKTRFGEQARLAVQNELATEEFWQQLAREMQGINIPTVGFTPAPRRLDFTSTYNASLAKLDGAVLLVRAEAYYLGQGALFSRTAIPMLLAAGSASAGSHIYTYTVFKSPPPSSDVILVQMFLVNSSTRELMWYGQVIMPQFYRYDQVAEKTATKAAEQVPAVFLERQLRPDNLTNHFQ